MTAPDLTRKVIGYRVFTLSGGELHSINGGNIWMPGANKARCDARMRQQMASPFFSFSLLSEPAREPAPKPKTHTEVPGAECHCGLYAYHEVPEEWREGALKGNVGGVIQAWGRMEVHSNGFRAEYAEVALLVFDPYCGPKQLKKIKKAARLYSAETVNVDDLDVAKVASLGESIPPSLVPEKPEPTKEITEKSATLTEAAAGLSYSWPSMFGYPGYGTTHLSEPTTPEPEATNWWVYAIAAFQAGCAGVNLAFFFTLGHHWWSLVGAAICAGILAATTWKEFA